MTGDTYVQLLAEREAAAERDRKLAQASADFNEAARESCEAIVGLFADYGVQRDTATNAKRRQDKHGARIKAHLEHCTEDSHRDGEHGITAELQRREDLTFDVMSMPESLVVALAGLGALKVDVAVLRALKGKSSPVDETWRRFKMTGETVSLIVKVDRS